MRKNEKREKPELVSLIEPSTLDAILKRKSFEWDLMNYVIIIDRVVRCWQFVIRFEEQNFNLLLSPQQLPAAVVAATAKRKKLCVYKWDKSPKQRLIKVISVFNCEENWKEKDISFSAWMRKYLVYFFSLDAELWFTN